ncbi:hypothetical protein AAHE18_04G161800 [Arachis hypogaea]
MMMSPIMSKAHALCLCILGLTKMRLLFKETLATHFNKIPTTTLYICQSKIHDNGIKASLDYYS